ncbi:MAG: hypothetical protein HFJ60_02040 [Clostridia bacterium]|nr:hypothetical protein [Clostridia bacterium]
MVFLLIFLIAILMILTIRIKIELKNFKFNSQNKKHLEKNYEIKITLFTFQKIPILKTKINSKKIEKIMSNEKIRNIIEKQGTKIIEDKGKIDKEIFKWIKKMNIELEEMNLKILIGTEDASITAFIIPIISTALAIFLSKKIKKCNDKQVFHINPVYINQNLINIEFSGIFQIKMIHIINMICLLNKRKRVDKNERTSNRGSYDYGYE